MDAAEYTHLALGLIFVKYIPDGTLGDLAGLVSQIGFGVDASTVRDALCQVYKYCRTMKANLMAACVQANQR